MFTPNSLHGDAQEAAGYRKADNYQQQYRAGDRADFSNKFSGKMAALLGITEYSDAKFVEIMEGKFGADESLHAKRKEYKEGKVDKDGSKHDQAARIGMELNYSGAKSLSVTGLLFDDSVSIEAHLAGTRAANSYIESNLIEFRMTLGEIKELRAQGVEVTGVRLIDVKKGMCRVRADNWLVTECLHTVSRFNAEQTAGGDPQIHSHDTAGTHTFMYGKLRAIEFGKVFENQHLIDAVYKTAQRQYLGECGRAVFDTKDGFELSGFTRNDVELFSDGRCDRIPEFMGMQNELRKDPSHPQFGQFLDMKNPDHREYANLATRGGKGDFDFTRHAGESEPAGQAQGIESARAWWTHKAANPSGDKRVAVDVNQLRRRVEAAQEHGRLNPLAKRTPEQAYELAILHLTDKESAFKRRGTLLRHMLAFGLYQISPAVLDELISEKLKAGELVQQSESRFTSKHRLETEACTAALFTEGLGAVKPVTTKQMFDEQLSRYQTRKGFQLSAGQIAAARGVMMSTAATTIIVGLAGTGKSTVAELIKNVAEAEGLRVFGLAPGGKAVESLRDSIADKPDSPKQSDASYKPEVVTSQSAQFSEKWWADNVKLGTLVVLDEAALIESDQMLRLQQFAKTYGARLICVGDSSQNHPVGAGTPFQQMSGLAEAAATSDGIYKLTEMLRAKDADTQALHETVFKDPAAALVMMHEKGRLVLIDDEAECLAAIAKQYAGLTEEARDNTFVITSRNASRRLLNAAIRTELGLDTQQGLEFDSFERLGGLTAADLKSASQYEEGMTVYFNKTVAVTVDGNAYQKGEACRVLAVEGATVKLARTVRDANGERTVIVDFHPLTQSDGISLGGEERITFCLGERIRFTAADKKLGVSNGDRGVVEAIDFETRVAKVRLTDTKRLVTLPLPEHSRGLSVRQSYSATGVSSQGGTAKSSAVVIKYAPMEHSMSFNEIYTDVTRSVAGAKSFQLYTNARGADAVTKLMTQAGTKIVHDRAHALSKEALDDVKRVLPKSAFSAEDGWSNRIEAKPHAETPLLEQLKAARDAIGPEIGLHGNAIWAKKVLKTIVDNTLDIRVTNDGLQEYQKELWDAKKTADVTVRHVGDRPIEATVEPGQIPTEPARNRVEPEPETREAAKRTPVTKSKLHPRPSPYDDYEYER